MTFQLMSSGGQLFVVLVLILVAVHIRLIAEVALQDIYC